MRFRVLGAFAIGLLLAGTAAAPLVRGCTLGSISMTCYGAGTDGVACTQGGAGADVPTGVPPDQTNV